MKLELFKPDFGSPLTDLIIDLEVLRHDQISQKNLPYSFYQLKDIFHMLESLGSARIEGNNTTVANFIETKIEERPYIDEDIQEIRNIETALSSIEDIVKERGITKSFIKEMHSIVVNDLHREGDRTPGAFRSHSVEITGATHTPPGPLEVDGHMEELVEFINEDHAPKYDLLKVAIIHHRFMWIHPFGNGNGRTGRLLTYAMLVSQGFKVGSSEKILNPTAVFCIDRNEYNKFLSLADTGTQEGIEEWCQYVLTGLKKELEKINQLSNYDYLATKILQPAIDHAKTQMLINATEYKILSEAIAKKSIKNNDVQVFFPNKTSQYVSKIIRSLKERKMLSSDPDNQRKYHICFTNNFLMRGVIVALSGEGFISNSN